MCLLFLKVTVTSTEARLAPFICTVETNKVLPIHRKCKPTPNPILPTQLPQLLVENHTILFREFQIWPRSNSKCGKEMGSTEILTNNNCTVYKYFKLSHAFEDATIQQPFIQLYSGFHTCYLVLVNYGSLVYLFLLGIFR